MCKSEQLLTKNPSSIWGLEDESEKKSTKIAIFVNKIKRKTIMSRTLIVSNYKTSVGSHKQTNKGNKKTKTKKKK